jgi:Ca2+-binding RTX toxin-like protein
MSGMTTDTDATTITTAASVKATIKTGLGADTVTGSGFGDSITTGAGADTITGGAGADIIVAGTGTDLVSYADVTLATSHSLANLSGIAVNLSATAVTAATVATAMGGTVVIGGGVGVAGGDLAAGSAGYLTTAAANSTATMVRDSISGAESVTGTALADYIAAGATAGTITAGGGVDQIVGGAASDVIVLGDSTDGNNYDVITGFTTAADDIQALQSVHGWNSTNNTTTVSLQTGATLKAADAAGVGNVLTLSGNVGTHTYATFMAGTSNYAQLETNAASAMGLTGALDAAAIVLVAIDDGAHTGLWQLTSGDNAIDDAVATTEIELIGILVGVTNATALVAGDFVFT